MRAIRRAPTLLIVALAVAALGTAPAPALGPSGTWETKAPMSPRGDAMAGVIAGRLYVAGGGAPGGGSTNTLQEYDPATDAWAAKAPMPTSRAVGGAAVIDGKLYVVGGWLNSDSNTPTGVLEVYDPATNTWATRAPMPTPRGSMAVAAIGGKLYVTGGRGPCCAGHYPTLEIYDPATDSWTTGAPVPTPRGGAAAAVVDGKLYVVGGTVPGPAEIHTGVVEAYDPATNTWASLAAMPTARAGAAAGVLGDGIHVVGGSNATSGALAVHEAYDPAANAWTSQEPMPTGRRVAVADVVGERLYVVGGSNPTGTLGTNEAFTPSSGKIVRFGTDQSAPRCVNVLRPSCDAGGSTPWLAGAALAGAFRIAPDSTYQPDLVDGVVVDEPDPAGKRPFALTYAIKAAARWSDGTPVGADDFLFTLAVITDPANEIGGAVDRAAYELIERATAIDAKTVRFEFASPYAAWRDLFPWVLPKHVLAGRDFDTVWQTAIDDPATGEPIGSGPFLLTRSDGSSLTLARNEAWWGTPAPALDSVVVRFYNGTGPLVAAFQGGDLDAIYANVAGTTATRASLAGLRADPSLVIQSSPGPGIEHIELNLAAADMPLLAQPWFRRSIAYALDREAVATRLFGAVAPGTTAAQSLIYSPTQAEYEPHFSRYPYDPVAVRAIMEEQGCITGADGIWSCDGIRASVKLATTTGNPSRAEAQDELIGKARAAGIELVADNSPAGFLFGTRLPSGAYQMSMFTWVWPTGDPIGFTRVYACDGAGNFTSYCSRPVTTFLGSADRELDPTRRAALVNRAHSRLSSDVPGIPLYRRPTFLAYENTLAGLRDNPVRIEGPTWNIEQWELAE